MLKNAVSRLILLIKQKYTTEYIFSEKVLILASLAACLMPVTTGFPHDRVRKRVE